MKAQRIFRTPDTCDLDHVVLLVTQLSHDLWVMYKPPDLSAPEAAARAAVMTARLLTTLESHHELIKDLRDRLKGARLQPRDSLQGRAKVRKKISDG